MKYASAITSVVLLLANQTAFAAPVLTEKPTVKVSRMAFVQMVTQTMYKDAYHKGCIYDQASYPGQTYTHLFKDIPVGYPLAGNVCVAMRNGLITEDANGNFRPNDAVTLGEASKILYKAFTVGPYDRRNVTGAPWYAHYVWDVRKAGIITGEQKDAGQNLVIADAQSMMNNAYRGMGTQVKGSLRMNISAPTITIETIDRTNDTVEPTEEPSTVESTISSDPDSPESIVRTHRIQKRPLRRNLQNKVSVHEVLIQNV